MSVQDIKLANGLKEALENYGLTLEKIMNYSAEEIAHTLGIDRYVATLIKQEAKKTRTEVSNSTLLLA